MSTSARTAVDKLPPVVINALRIRRRLTRYVEERTKDEAKETVMVYLTRYHWKNWGFAIQKIEQDSTKSLEYYKTNLRLAPGDAPGDAPTVVPHIIETWNPHGFMELGSMPMKEREEFIKCITEYGGKQAGKNSESMFCYFKAPRNYIMDAWDHASERGTLAKDLHDTGMRRMSKFRDTEEEYETEFKKQLEHFNGFYRHSDRLVKTWSDGNLKKVDLYDTAE